MKALYNIVVLDKNSDFLADVTVWVQDHWHATNLLSYDMLKAFLNL
jgi:hypothetical protein